MKNKKLRNAVETNDDNIKDAGDEVPTGDVPENAQTDSETSVCNPQTQNADSSSDKKRRGKKKELSGAYWYTLKDDAELLKCQQIRTLIHVIALMLQLVVLVMPQEGLEYVTKYISSYAFVYMWAVFITLGTSVYVIIMDCVRNKIQKRIPIERAPKNGFKRRAFFTAELDIAVNALIFLFELTFVCIHYDGFGLLSMFITATATGVAVWARQIEHLTLKDAERIQAPENHEDSDENAEK